MESLRLRALATVAVLAVLSLGAATAPAFVSDGVPEVAAAGDRVTFRVDEVGRLDPERAKAVNVTLTFCAGSELSPQSGPREVTLLAEDAPEWLRVTFQPPTHTFTTVLPSDCQRQTGLMRLNSTRAAPGFELSSFLLRATLGASGSVGHREEVFFMSGFYGELAIRGPTDPVAVPAGGMGDAAIRVENRGNAATRVLVEPVAAPDGVAVTVESPATLPPFGDGRNEHAFPLRILLGEGAPTEPFEVRLLVSSHFQFDPTLQGAGGLVVVRVTPGEAEDSPAGLRVPGPAPGLALLAVAAAAALVARRRAA